MTDSWDAMRKAKEEQYFLKQNESALKRIKEREKEKPRLSPITGKPMVQKTLMGVVIDQCEESRGIWLDNGELEALIEASNASEVQEKGLFSNLLKGLLGR